MNPYSPTFQNAKSTLNTVGVRFGRERNGKFIFSRFVIVSLFAFIFPTQRACAQNPKTLEEALLEHNWEWTHAPKPPDQLVFGADGIARCPRFSWHWKITGPRTALAFDAISEGKALPKFKATLTFDESFTTLEAHTSDNKVRYTGRRMTPLAKAPASGANAAAISTPATIQTDPNQPRIEVLKDQAPNAIEWALAPLDQAVPGDIRQNLTFLREDLLTETQDKPKLGATRDAGAKLCDAIIGVLDERKLTLAKAGFRAVEAGARTGVTSQALEARRNYKMSWPQFAREESQRAELKSQAIGNAQVISERPKLDWAQRTSALQKPLDDLYRQYCEALRQSAK